MMDLPPPPMVPLDAPQELVHRLEQKTELTLECLERVVDQYDVHPVILSIIARVEGGWAGARVENTNQTYDLGKMQINTIHLEYLRRYGITEKMVQNNDCINVGYAAYYVRKVTQGQTAMDSWEYLRAIARYHSKNEPHRSNYARRLKQEFESAFGQYVKGAPDGY